MPSPTPPLERPDGFYVVTRTWLHAHRALSHGATLLLILLQTYIHGRRKPWAENRETLCADLGIKPRQLSTYLAELRAAGLITAEQEDYNSATGHRWGRNAYEEGPGMQDPASLGRRPSELHGGRPPEGSPSAVDNSTALLDWAVDWLTRKADERARKAVENTALTPCSERDAREIWKQLPEAEQERIRWSVDEDGRPVDEGGMDAILRVVAMEHGHRDPTLAAEVRRAAWTGTWRLAQDPRGATGAAMMDAACDEAGRLGLATRLGVGGVGRNRVRDALVAASRCPPADAEAK